MKFLGPTVAPGQRFHNQLLLKRYVYNCVINANANDSGCNRALHWPNEGVMIIIIL